MHKDVFEEIKNKLLKSPILPLSDTRGGFQLFSGTNKMAVGSSLYQIHMVLPS